jgi:hypothetical protein
VAGRCSARRRRGGPCGVGLVCRAARSPRPAGMSGRPGRGSAGMLRRHHCGGSGRGLDRAVR